MGFNSAFKGLNSIWIVKELYETKAQTFLLFKQ